MNKDSSRSHLLFILYLESGGLSIPEEIEIYCFKAKFSGFRRELKDK
jgi:hypothetical protein